LWEGWKGSSHGSAGQLLQKATADELGGRLNPKMVAGAANKQLAGELAQNASNAYDAVKAYVRGKWETTQYMLAKAGINTVNLYRAVNIPETRELKVEPTPFAGPNPFQVKATKSFDSEEEANNYVATEKNHYPGTTQNSVVSQQHETWKAQIEYRFSERAAADKFIEQYQKDPNNPEQHIEEVSTPSEQLGGGYSTSTQYNRLPNINVVRNGASSMTTDRNVANAWGGSAGRVVLRASVPRTAVISVPAYGQNIHGEHEVVVAGTAWKGWDSWRGQAPPFDQIKIGHQVA
jgi:hypothetical protein